MSLYLYTVNFTHLFVPLCFSSTDGLPPADEALVRQFLLRAVLRKSRILMYFILFFPFPPARGTREFFSNIHPENQVKLLEVKPIISFIAQNCLQPLVICSSGFPTFALVPVEVCVSGFMLWQVVILCICMLVPSILGAMVCLLTPLLYQM